LDDSRRC